MIDVPTYLGWSVDDSGNMYHYGRMVKGTNDGGYIVTRQRGVRKIKRATLVCTAYHGFKPFALAEVCHNNDIHDDDRPENLRWGTHADNMKDAGRNGLMARSGEIHGRCVLSDVEAIELRAGYDSGMSVATLARQFGVSWSQTDRIAKRKQRAVS